MTELCILIIHVGPPDAGENIPLRLTLALPNEVKEISTFLKLPFPLDQIPILLRALNARQYPDYPFRDRLFTNGEDQELVIASLQTLGLWDNTKAPHSVPIDVHRRVGRLLGEALFALPEFTQFMHELYQSAIVTGNGEIILSFDTDPRAMQLAALPWEATHHPQFLQPILLSKGVVLGCARIIVFDHAIRPPVPPKDRLCILTVAPYAGIDVVGRAFEQLARGYLRDRLRTYPFDIENLMPATMKALAERLRKKDPPVDILDFYGHGTFIDDDGALLMDGEHGGTDYVSAERLQALGNDLPPLIVLHACYSAHVSIHNPFTGIAPALCSAGVRAVLAMQLTAQMPAITDHVIPTFYEELARGASVQQAVARVRQDLRTTEGGGGTSWYLPALYLRQSDRRPIVLLRRTEPPQNPFAGPGALQDAKRFVGRASKVRRLWGRLKVGASLAIVGPGESGKSSMLRLIAEEAHSHVDPSVKVIQLDVSSSVVAMKTNLVTALDGTANENGINLLPRLLKDKHIILLLDDLGELDPGEDGLRVRTWLRGLAHSVVGYKVQLVATCQRTPTQLFSHDSPKDSSTLAGTLSDMIELGSFDKQEARLYIEKALDGTPFTVENFADLLDGSLMPGELHRNCRNRYDKLSDDWDS